MTKEMQKWVMANLDPYSGMAIMKAVGFQQSKGRMSDYFNNFAKENLEYTRWLRPVIGTREYKRTYSSLITTQDLRRIDAAYAAFNVVFPEQKLRNSYYGIGAKHMARHDLYYLLTQLGLKSERLKKS